MALPLNPPGALGTGEALYAFLLDRAGVPQGAVLSLLLRLMYTLWGLGGTFAFALGHAGSQRDEKTEPNIAPAWSAEAMRDKSRAPAF